MQVDTRIIMEPMHVGLVTACYHPVLNGVTRSVVLQKRALEALGHRVTVFTLGSPQVGLSSSDVVISPAVPVGQGYFAALRYDQAAQDRLRQVDLVHCHHLVMALEFARRYAAAPIVYTNHTRYDLYAQTYLPLPDGIVETIMRYLWPALADRADWVISPSHDLRARLQALGLKRPVEVIPNGIDLRPFQRPQEEGIRRSLGVSDSEFLCIYVGRLADEKDLHVLIDQFCEAVRLASNLSLLVVGGGPKRRELERRSFRLPLQRRIMFTGPVPPGRIPGFLAAADLFISASQSEVLPISAMEAQAVGLPIVARHAPGFDEIVEPEITGLLAGDSGDELAHAIARMAGEPDTCREMAAAAEVASARFDIRATTARTLGLYRDMLGGSARYGRVEEMDAPHEGGRTG